ncbi:uncharacterized protein LOC118195360 isoform X2 [Stegodyphus dumicola]|nr:uncharacterized protein LOC118195360 isoform X2 [Stegodyphus dumicola]
MNCIAEAAKSCYIGPSTLEMYVLSNRMFLFDLCEYTPGSTSRWRMKYLESVPCINNQDFHKCTSAVIGVDRNLLDVSTKCLVRDKLSTCIYKTILDICGEDAAALSRHLLILETDDFTCAIADNQTEDAQTELKPSYLLKHRIGSDSEHERQHPESLDKKLQLKNDLMDVKESNSSQTNYVRQEIGKVHSTLVSNISKLTKTYCDYIHDENAHCEADRHNFREVSETSSVSRNVGEKNIDVPSQRSTSDTSDANREEHYGIETSHDYTQDDRSLKSELDHYLKFPDCEKSESEEACVINRELQYNAFSQSKDFKRHAPNSTEETDNREQILGTKVKKMSRDRDLDSDLHNLFLTRLANEQSKNFEIPISFIKPEENKSRSEFRNFRQGNTLVFWVDMDFNQMKYLCTLATLANQTTYVLCADVLKNYNPDYSSLDIERNQQEERTTIIEPNTLDTEEKSGLKDLESMHLEEYYSSKNENYEESVNITEFLRKIGENNHDVSKMQIKTHVHSASGKEANAKSEITGSETPVLKSVTTRAEELHDTSPKSFSGRYLHEDYINLEDPMENYEFIVSDELSDFINERYIDLEIPVLDLSHKFAIRSMPIIERIVNPELNIKAFQYSDRTVNVYWGHPFIPPFNTMTCRKANIIEQYNKKTFTCIITLD